MSTLIAPRAPRLTHAFWFLRHLLEMTVAMMVGMLALGLIVSAAGSDLREVRLSYPEPALLLMAFSMSVPMVAWMRHRGHGWRNGVEMSGAMFVPVFALIVCYWVGAVSAEPMCPLACAAMIPAMALAMLFRLEHYTGRHADV